MDSNQYIHHEQFFENQQVHTNNAGIVGEEEEEEETYIMDANNMYEVVESEYPNMPYYVHNEHIVETIGMEMMDDQIVEPNAIQQPEQKLFNPSPSGVETPEKIQVKNAQEEEHIYPVQGEVLSNFPPKTIVIRHENLPPKKKKNRFYGDIKCPECNQSFINENRLNRHLSSHQVFGSFVCPLCTKIFKYEYNLSYHWRRTCAELKDLLDDKSRTHLSVDELRVMVDTLAIKKPTIGPIDIGISKAILFQGGGPTAKLEIPNEMIGRRGAACHSCNVIVPTAHFDRHSALHSSDFFYNPDEPAASGGYFCDLCGISYRLHSNLLNHWRTSCPEIQANLPGEGEVTLDMEGLRHMVLTLLQRAQVKKAKKTKEEEEGETESSQQSSHKIPYVAPRPSYIAEGRDHGIVYADDFGDDGMLFCAHDGTIQLGINEKSKWKLPEEGENTTDFRCPECLKSFANKGRLDKHLMGFHNNFGKHSCLLCGSAFKYGYNLLYHYRKTCPYTRVYVEKPLRDSLVSSELRKIVLNMASQRSQLKAHLKRSLDPAKIHKIQPIIRERKKFTKMPYQLLYAKPELSNRNPTNCPFCQVVFYEIVHLNRHVENAHGKPGFRYNPPQKIEEDVEEKPEDIEPPPKLERQDFEIHEESGIRIITQDGTDMKNYEQIDENEIAVWLEATQFNTDTLVTQGTDGILYEVQHQETLIDEGGNKTYIVNIREDKTHIIYEEEYSEPTEQPPVLEVEEEIV